MQRTITRRTERAHVLNTDEIRATLKHLGIWPDMRNNERLTITAMDFDSKACALTVRTTLVEVPISAEQPMPPAPVAMTSEELRRSTLAQIAPDLEGLALLGVPTEPSKPAWQKFDKRLQLGPAADAHPKDWSIFTDKNGTSSTGLEFYARGSEQCMRDLWKERDKRKGQWVLYDGERQPVAELYNGEDQLAKLKAAEAMSAELQKATPADLPAMGVPAIPAWPPIAQRAALRCVCRDKIGDNGPCPAHPAIPQPEPAVPIITGQQVEAMTDPRETQPEPAAEPEEALRAPVHLPKCDPGYRWLTDGELTDPKKGDEFNQGSGAGHGWHLTSRTGRLVHAGLVGAYRRPISAAAAPEQAPMPVSKCTCPERQPGPHHENPDCPVHGDNQPEPAPPASPFLGGSPFLVPHSKLCDSGARDHNCPGCQPTTCTCTGEIADPNCPEHRDL